MKYPKVEPTYVHITYYNVDGGFIHFVDYAHYYHYYYSPDCVQLKRNRTICLHDVQNSTRRYFGKKNLKKYTYNTILIILFIIYCIRQLLNMTK